MSAEVRDGTAARAESGDSRACSACGLPVPEARMSLRCSSCGVRLHPGCATEVRRGQGWASRQLFCASCTGDPVHVSGDRSS